MMRLHQIKHTKIKFKTTGMHRILSLCACLFLCSCGATGSPTTVASGDSGSQQKNGSNDTVVVSDQQTPISSASSTPDTSSDSGNKGVTSKRDNSTLCLVPEASGELTTGNEVVTIDYSNSQDGYLCVCYTGESPKVKLRITGPDTVIYTYDLHTGATEVFPLSVGNGAYDVGVYEIIQDTMYSTCFYTTLDVTIENEFGPFLYPNQYVNFNKDNLAVVKAAELAADATSDLDLVTIIYDYIIENISYDYDLAKNPPTGYLPVIDNTLTTGKGICFDYASLIASMLRSQRIPTRLEIGYAQNAKHAWISVYTEELGWVNDVVRFDGSKWTLMDPTFGANTSESALKKFIGDGSHYTLQQVY